MASADFCRLMLNPSFMAKGKATKILLILLSVLIINTLEA